jgi:hypothetical protein
LSNQLKLLKNDFNQIQKTFFEGIIPTPNLYGLIMEDKVADTDVDDVDSNHSFRTGESDLISVESPPVATTNEEIEKLKQEIVTGASSQPIVTPPVIKQYRVKRKRDGKANGMGVINTPDIKTFSKSGERLSPKSIRVIREGSQFSGYEFKKVFNGKYTLWALQTDPNVPPTEWAYQGPGDDVELIQ